MAKKSITKKGNSAASSSHKVISQSGVHILIPILLTLVALPLVVRLKLIMLPASIQRFWTTNYAADFFSYYKSIVLILIALAMIGFLIYHKAWNDAALREKSFRIYLIATGVFALLTILATLFSGYKSIAVWGAPERREGMVVLLVYLIVMIYAFWAFLKQPNERFVVIPLAVLVGITTFLGIFQFWGHDIFSTSFGQSLIIPSEYRAHGTLQMLHESGKVYGTMYHYNYMGSFAAMMIPFFLVLALFNRDSKLKLIYGVVTLCSLFLLLGSTSRAGIIGLIFATLCFLIVFGRKLIQHYKATLGCVAGLVVFVFAINLLTGGLALARVPSLIRDAGALFAQSDVDYHTRIPLQHIDLQKDSVTLQYSDTTVTITKNRNNQPVIRENSGDILTAPGEDAEFSIGKHKFELQYLDINGTRTPFIALYEKDSVNMILGLFDDSFSFVDSRINRVDYKDAPSIGFKGKERLGSARGYIWSRSLPLVVKSPVFGYGPDTFFAVFPQGDLLAKYYAYGTSQMLVDKAHNLYLQIAISEGVPALIAFLVLVLAYLASSFRLYALRKEYSSRQALGAAITLAIIGYLGAGFFNDSIVSVAPIFWTLLGVGIALNFLNRAVTDTDTEKTE